MKKQMALLLAVSVCAVLASCGASAPSQAPSSAASTSNPASVASTPTTDGAATPKAGFSVGMVNDKGLFNDQSFNQSAHDAFLKMQKKGEISYSYLETKQATEIDSNLESLRNQEADLIWGIGFGVSEPITNAARLNPDQQYALIDTVLEATLPNLTGVVFRAEEPSFLVGYIAGMMTKTNQVGFLGGMESEIVFGFQYGYEAGVAQAAKEKGKTIEVMIQYADSFTDKAKGNSIATELYGDGADILFHASGAVGLGAFEAAKETGKYIIGVDSDQSHLAPVNTLTSAMKRIGEAAADVTTRIKKGEKLGGQTISLGCKEGMTGLAPTSSKLIPAAILEKAAAIEKNIIDGSIQPPATKEALAAFLETLK